MKYNMNGFILPTNDPNVIDEFRGKYFFLSNFYIKPVYYNSEWFRSSEHAFQYQKAVSDIDKQYILNSQYPGEAKRKGNEITLRPDWDNIKMMEMYSILRCKFTESDGVLSAKLIETEDALLIEGNSWGDKYWGKVRDLKTGEWVGENFLGQLLMKVRHELR